MATWFDSILKNFTGSDGDTDLLRGLLTTGGSYLMNESGIGQAEIPKTGYQGDIPSYEVQRDVVPGTYNPDRRAGSGGQRYFTDTQYNPKSETPAAPMSAEGLAALNKANPAQQRRPGGPRASMAAPILPAEEITTMAAGGIAQLKQGKYLDGKTDGMADKVPASIEGEQEARLSDGEFVIPADVVSHLGNGNSDAGAKVLEDMMSRVRKERTGNSKQGKQINPKKFLPA
tara:strand:+ start:961 stop:1650 length:690 start_codon:yes stop_codon:yes gene_type:complete